MPRHVLLNHLQESNISYSMSCTVSMMTNELETAIFLANDEQFALARKTVLKLVEVIRQNVHEAMLVVHEEWLPLFKEKKVKWNKHWIYYYLLTVI